MGPADECFISLHAASLDNAEQQQDERQRSWESARDHVFRRSK